MPSGSRLVFLRDTSAGPIMASRLVARLSAGFPSPAENYLEEPIDLKRYLIRNEAATFLMRIQGFSMEGMGIFDGDLAVIDRSLPWYSGCVGIARIDDEYTLKRIVKEGNRLMLMPESNHYQPIELKEGMDADIIAVLTFTVRQHYKF